MLFGNESSITGKLPPFRRFIKGERVIDNVCEARSPPPFIAGKMPRK
jgi:hypothetical protein